MKSVRYEQHTKVKTWWGFNIPEYTPGYLLAHGIWDKPIVTRIEDSRFRHANGLLLRLI